MAKKPVPEVVKRRIGFLTARIDELTEMRKSVMAKARELKTKIDEAKAELEGLQ